jgi:hypothetical protein
MCTSDLFFDVGMHLGEDTAFDIEGRDMLCVAALRDLADRPNARLGSA